MAKQGHPALYDLDTLVQAGIDPKTGLPIKVAGALEGSKKEDIKKALRIVDEQDAVNRYIWYNLPCDITSQELERMLYYKGQLCFFYSEPLDKFFFMPYALDGTIDFYGRYNRVHPVPMSNGTTEDEKKLFAAQAEYLSTLKLNVLYDIPLEDVDPFNSCVLVHDYTKQLSQTVVSRQIIQDPILDIMSECIPYMKTALMNATGVLGMRVNSQDEESNVKAANNSINRAALSGQRYIPIVAGIDFQSLADGNVAKAEEYLLAMQALDNFRLSLYGLENGGLFQKKAHILQSEQEMNAGHTQIPLQDGLSIRQHMCDIANAIWGIGMSCEIAESALGADLNGDMLATDEFDQSGGYQGQQPDMGGSEDVE